MTKQDLIDQLTAENVPFDASSTVPELQELWTAHQEAQTGTPANGTSTANLASLFKAAPVRLTQENFEGVEVGTQADARMVSARKSRNGEYWLGTFEFPGFGTVQTVIGAANELSIKDAMELKGFSMTLTYTGQASLPTKDGGAIILPKFRLNF